MLKIKKCCKSNDVAQLNNYVVANVDTASYVKIVTATHSQYNSDVAIEQYTKYTKCQKNTGYNHILYSVTDETLDFTRFVTIGEEPIFGHCITTQDLINIYTNDCIQEFYETYCKLHSHKENVILAKVLSILGIEIWKDVTCFGGIYKGKYMVSNLGNVKRLYKTKDFTKILKQFDGGKPCYLYVNLCHNGKRQNVRVNRLVALTYYGEPTEQLDCCHANTNRYDNRLFNLNFGTRSDNLNNPITRKKCKDTWVTKAKAKADKESTAPTE